MSLSELRHGQKARISNIPDNDLRTQLLRFGVTTGSEIHCHCRLPFGPVVIRFAGQEIALGRSLANQVFVEC